ncbi:antirestriction protein ArdA [Christensenellaceae bacterium OttesenSCG-928-K19]|nr:antirestriction protein ArdA [Christensenellaceae bacterium OttesenSCG-928-K19]
MAEQHLYSVEYKDWNSDLSGLLDRSVLAVGENEAAAIENAKKRAYSDSRDFKATQIETVMGMGISVAQPEERVADARPSLPREGDGSIALSSTPIRAYIENVHDDSIGGFTIPLPVTKETLQPWLEAIEAGGFHEADIVIREVRSSVPGLDAHLQDILADGITFDEFNYLASKIASMDKWRMELFVGALDAKYHCGNIQDLMNLPENTVRLELQPAFSAEQYGEFLIEAAKDNSAHIFERLEKSDDYDERGFAEYILRLEAHVDVAAFGRGVIAEENGILTEYGYLAERGPFQETYRGPEDIPMEYRIFSAMPPPMLAAGADMPSLLAALHATAGDYSRDAEHNIGTLSQLRSAEYLLLMDGSGAYLTEAMHAYRHGTTAFDLWINAPEKVETQAYAIHLTEVHGEIKGDIAQVDIAARQLDMLHHSIQYTRVDAISKSGEEQTFAPTEWEAMSPIDRDKIESWTRHFDGDDLQSVIAHLDDLRGREASACRSVYPSDFLSGANEVYMAHAQNPQPDMLRVSQTAAKEMLARGDCEVYRLLPEGAEKLSPTDAVKSGLWFSEHREFAIRREDSAGLQKWAERSAGDAISHAKSREIQNKSREPEI